ncbi:hypothetical protein Skr01_44910 [Sphaerisporangium krabiense]|uniref:DUF397 domain-containing protein n=1 Tax=Sphaerisporangium krabiense TaxID=763782 RepID=A0A7W9DQG0_9ACTN|nr:DUF397 domain-containing protein [Sphaerisporangium krabiense]MBB5627456.1 hypothetical protein [Sphaerisporangium krabiense]GII64406.1 hypothetical protein Skr01_44910 [Sphaerisporangium krabiense]
MALDLRRAQWRKSTFSGPEDNCVEVASNLSGIRAVRDSKNPTGPALVFSSSAWTMFLTGITDGTLDV